MSGTGRLWPGGWGAETLKRMGLDNSGHGAGEEDVLTIRLLHEKNEGGDEEEDRSDDEGTAEERDAEAGMEASSQSESRRRRCVSSVRITAGDAPPSSLPSVRASSGPDAQGLLSTFRHLAHTLTNTVGPKGRERGASTTDIAQYASKALHRAVSQEEVEQLFGPPPHTTPRDPWQPPPPPSASGDTLGSSSDKYYSAEDFRSTLSAKIDEARSSFDPSQPLSLLTFNRVSCSYTRKGGSKNGRLVTVLKDVSGLVAPGWMVAIMGPSGAGKSTMLDILAMRKTVGTITGDILINGVPRDASFHQISSYVAQEDIFLPTLTVHQTLRYYMDLRLGPSISSSVKERRLRRLLKEVGLGKKERAMVGGPLAGGLSIRGLSGGERRRLSICCGTVAKPALLFLDEPTSGLDAMSALLVMEVMEGHAKRGMGVVCTIHQPRPAIWRMFDKLLLLSEGRVLFFSDTRHVSPWFCTHLGYAQPPDASHSDFVLDLVNVSFEKEGLLAAGADQPPPTPHPHSHTPHSHAHPSPRSADPLSLSSSHATAHTNMVPPQEALPVKSRSKSSMVSVEELDAAAHAWEGSSYMRDLRALEVLYVFHLTSLGVYGVTQRPSSQGQGWLSASVSGLSTQIAHFRLLLWRCCLNYVRNPGNATARLFITTLTALVHGLAFYKLGQEDDAQNRLGSLYFGCTSLALMPYASMSLFVYDRQFYAKDSAAGLYGVLPYFLSSMLLEALLLSLCGLIYATITYALVGQVLAQGSGSFVSLAGTYVLHSLVSAQFVQLMAIIAPNQDVGFVAGAGYTSASMLVCGFLVTYPTLGVGLRWMQWLAFFKFTFQALAANEFMGTPLQDTLINGALDLDHPRGVGYNLLCLGGFGLAFALLSMLGLKFLHRERR